MVITWGNCIFSLIKSCWSDTISLYLKILRLWFSNLFVICPALFHSLFMSLSDESQKQIYWEAYQQQQPCCTCVFSFHCLNSRNYENKSSMEYERDRRENCNCQVPESTLKFHKSSPNPTPAVLSFLKPFNRFVRETEFKPLFTGNLPFCQSNLVHQWRIYV